MADGGGGEGRAEGRRRRDKGISRVLSKNAPWCAEVDALFHQAMRLIASGEFTGEDYNEALRAVGASEPSHPNAWSGRVRVLKQQGLFKPTGRRTPPKNPRSHARPLDVYVYNWL